MKNSWSNKVKLYGNILVPSGLSLTISLTFALLTLFIYHLHVFVNYFDPKGSLGVGNYILDYINRYLSFLFGNNDVDNAVLFMFWASVGLIVYVIARVILRDLTELSSEVVHRNKYLWPRGTHPNLLEKFFERFLFGIAILLVLFVYCAHVLSFFFRGKVLVPGFLSPHAASWLSSHSIINQIIFVVLEVIALHVALVFVRMLFVRNRLFS